MSFIRLDIFQQEIALNVIKQAIRPEKFEHFHKNRTGICFSRLWMENILYFSIFFDDDSIILFKYFLKTSN